jgi:pyruvate dehydrogenase E1 component alpha subunit
MEPDVWVLYRLMLRSRLFENEVIRLWNEGKISGEMHLGNGEEAIVAGVIAHLQEGDALALDHRGTAPLIMRGVDPVLLMKELLGHSDGLCCGMGGHMHLFSREHLALSSGIVGASAPAAVGFALSAQYFRPGKIALAFFGEGAVNQGMVMESFNLATTWNLPVLFICKDNRWSITTPSDSVTSGKLSERAKSFGMFATECDGSDVMAVWKTAGEAIERARQGKGPSFLHMHCVRPEGHFLGDPLIRISRQPIKEMKKMAGPLLKSVTKIKGSSIFQRSASLGKVSATLGKNLKGQMLKGHDPLQIVREQLKSDRERVIKTEVTIKNEIEEILKKALQSAA